MAEYKETHGTKIQNYTSDPDNPLTGQVWFNDTDNALKFQYQGIFTGWATTGSLNLARQSGGGAGINTAALYFGGFAPSIPGYVAQTESTMDLIGLRLLI